MKDTDASPSIPPVDAGLVHLPNATLDRAIDAGGASGEEARLSIPSDNALGHDSSPNEQEWPLKSILWPPFAENPREVKILMQDVNGPCSFLALCNVLLVCSPL